MTEKLYYKDSHIREFTAEVTSCREMGDCWGIELDRTAFFPEGGGQSADTGYIGEARVQDVRETDGRILHYTAQPIAQGENVSCRIDWEQRLRRMQNHSGEHVFSGLIHSLCGYDNVGFHMGQDCLTLDFSGEVSRETLEEAERLANEAVRENKEIRTYFPEPEELKGLEYRSKLELTENVRIVEIPGIDRCACCAPHVKRTGEIGLIKLLEWQRHRGGTRVSILCGMDALEYMNIIQRSNAAVSAALSAKRENTAAAVERLLEQQSRYKERIAALSEELARFRAAAIPETEGNICVFDSVMDETALRELVNLLSGKCGGAAAAFSGSDESGYRYIIGSRRADLRKSVRQINEGIGGRGGGSSEMIQGSASKTAAEIYAFFKTLEI